MEAAFASIASILLLMGFRVVRAGSNPRYQYQYPISVSDSNPPTSGIRILSGYPARCGPQLDRPPSESAASLKVNVRVGRSLGGDAPRACNCRAQDLSLPRLGVVAPRHLGAFGHRIVAPRGLGRRLRPTAPRGLRQKTARLRRPPCPRRSSAQRSRLGLPPAPGPSPVVRDSGPVPRPGGVPSESIRSPCAQGVASALARSFSCPL